MASLFYSERRWGWKGYCICLFCCADFVFTIVRHVCTTYCLCPYRRRGAKVEGDAAQTEDSRLDAGLLGFRGGDDLARES